MGFQTPNLDPAYGSIRDSLIEITSPYTDGWTASSCKRDLYLLKCWLEDQYERLPKFKEESDWEKERIIATLKKE